MKYLILFVFLAGAQFTAAQDFNESMTSVMASMKEYTVEMIDRMPEDLYSYRPADSVRTFRETIQHMVTVNHFLLNYHLKGDGKGDPRTIGGTARELASVESKDDLINVVEAEFDEITTFFTNAQKSHYKKKYNFGTPDEPQWRDYFATAMLVRDHIAHHRANLIVYLRMNDIEPPAYVAF